MKLRRIISAIMWGSMFIAAGILLLLSSLGLIQFNLGDWWPVVLIIIGISIIVDGISKD